MDGIPLSRKEMISKQQISDVRKVFDSLLEKGYIFRKIDDDVVAYFSDKTTLYFGVERYSDDVEIKVGFTEDINFNESYSLGALYHTENNLELGVLADYNLTDLLKEMRKFIINNYASVTDEEYCKRCLEKFRERLKLEL